MTKRFVVYVERSVQVTQRTAMVITDEADLKAQLIAHEAKLRAAEYVGKPDRDPKGKVVMHALSELWDEE